MPEGPRPTGEGEAVWDTFMRVADAAAWSNVATAIDRTGAEVRLALHSDQDTSVSLDLSNAAGGFELFNWWTASPDGNRDEALRYVLRFVTASRSTLPEPQAIIRLAQRQLIALTRENAAEVQRAIAEGQRDATDALKSATDALGELVEESTKTANATVLAVLGIIALVARSSDDLPEWLVAAVALSGIAGVWAVVRSRRSRINDQQRVIEELGRRLGDDPLLPDEEKVAVAKRLTDFDVTSRATRALRTVTWLGGTAAVVVLAAAFWLIFVHKPASDAGSAPPSTTSSAPSPEPVPSETTVPSTSTASSSVVGVPSTSRPASYS
jgi:hypothetical protein